MEITISRHAQRRAKLYGIPISEIKEVIKSQMVVKGKQEIVAVIPGHPHPIKTIISLEEDTITVITIYPLKKGWQDNENTV